MSIPRFADVRVKVRPAVLTYDDIMQRPRFQLLQKMPMDTYQALSLMIAFATLVVLIMSTKRK